MGPAWDPAYVLLLWLTQPLLLTQVPAVRLCCLLASPSHASMAASAFPVKALGVL